MRIPPWVSLLLILLLTAAAGWVALPGDTLDVGGWKADHPIQQGLDLQGGVQVTLEARPPAGQSVDSGTLEGTRNTIERRVNALGVSEPVVQTRGNNQIIVELPGVENPDEAVEVVRETALLEIIDPQGQYLPAGTRVRTTLNPGGDQETATAATPVAGSPVASPGASPVASPAASPVATPEASETPVAAGPIYTTIISGSDLKDAYRATGPLGEQVVAFELNGSAADKMFEFTSQNIGRPMSIVIDGIVISSPSVNSAISSEGQIEGIPANEVDSLVVQLKAGSLAVPLEVVQSRTVGPTLGQDSIDKSLMAGLIGLGIVGLFMIFYYRLPGIISVLALLIYTLLVLALFKIIPVTLTLAGIAGFILSIGMAVDANVLIFSRLKEELRLGRPINYAIEDGFRHAWPSIRDSNIASMITAAILYWFGQYSGASIVTGFALTLFIGVAVSMFTAYTVTRTFLRVILGARPVHDLWWYGVNHNVEPAPAAAD
ncbi:MAG: protein translocase subunit SecD [Thermomicrobiales bacterium]|nr:protein translocase subunit SecD [Thermomicrobiales bacterium]